MKIAISGKGGVGKTSLTAWLGDYLARRGEKVWLVDADTALSLGVECQHVVHPPSLEAGGFLPRAECGRKKL